MEPPGITFLRPVWRLITQKRIGRMHGLNLNENDVDVYYQKYINNFKRSLTTDEESIEQAVSNRLTPGINTH